MKLTSKAILIVAILVFLPIGYSGLQKAEAQFSLSSLTGGLLGGGGEAVRIISDTSESSITSAIQNTLSRIINDLTSGQISSLNLKETVLDPIAWNVSKQLQQQLTGNLLKWIGGELPGQNGKTPFVQNFGEHYGKIAQEIAGEFLDSAELSGLCSPEEDFKARKQVYDYIVAQNNDQIFHCPNEDADTATDDNLLKRIFTSTVNCTGNSLCNGYKAQNVLAKKQAGAIAIEKQKLNISRGMEPQEVCKTINDPDGYPRRTCKIVNPLYLSGDAFSFQFAELPSLQLLQMDEFNEIVSNLMSNLTNQALTGLNGILGLTGNPEFSSNVFGPNGSLSYVDALIQDDVSKYQTGAANPIAEALKAEKKYLTIQGFILSEIGGLESKIATNTIAFKDCFSLELSPDLKEAKGKAVVDFAISSSTVELLTKLDQAYASTTASAIYKSAIMNQFLDLRNKNLIKTEVQIQQLEITSINFTFASMLDRFKYDLAVAQQECGGQFDYQGPLGSPPVDSPPVSNDGE